MAVISRASFWCSFISDGYRRGHLTFAPFPHFSQFVICAPSRHFSNTSAINELFFKFSKLSLKVAIRHLRVNLFWRPSLSLALVWIYVLVCCVHSFVLRKKEQVNSKIWRCYAIFIDDGLVRLTNRLCHMPFGVRLLCISTIWWLWNAVRRSWTWKYHDLTVINFEMSFVCVLNLCVCLLCLQPHRLIAWPLD